MKIRTCTVFDYMLLNILSFNIWTSFGKTLDYYSAKSQCETQGGLQPNNEFLHNNGFISSTDKHIEMFNLQNGESAWISGFAEYLKLLSWHGCYEEIGAVYKKSPILATFDQCLQYCKSYADQIISFIGLRLNTCFCIKTEDMQSKIIVDYNNECFQFNPYNFKYNISNLGKSISVFKIHNTLMFYPNPSAFKQCVYAKSISTSVVYGTTSCYKQNIDGFVCVNSALGKLNHTCNGFHLGDEGDQTFCIKNSSTDWITARQYCMNFSGELVDEAGPKIEKEMENTFKYWTGIFRSFKIVYQTSRVENVKTACLAVTRIHNKLVLDPDDCLVYKKYFCSDWKTISPPSTRYTVPTKVVPIITEKPENPETDSMKDAEIYIVVAVVVVLALGIVACIIVKCTKREKTHTTLQESMSVFVSNNECIEKTTDSNEVSCIYAQVSQTNRTKNVKPNKPLRHTLKRQNLDSSYENFKLKSNDIGNPDEQAKTVNEDYDRIDLKSIRTKPFDKDTMNESRIYDHTTANNFEEYDTMKASKLSQQFDFTYNTLQKKVKTMAQVKDITRMKV